MIDLEYLKQLAGETVYKRGEAIAKAGDVSITHNLCEGTVQQLSAQVRGTRRYNLELTLGNGQLTRALCTCPAFDYQQVCKHCVATVLAAHHAKPVSSEPAKPTKREQDEQLVLNHLLTLDKSQLAALLMDYIADDKIEWKGWLLKAELVGQPTDKKILKKLITKALPKKNLWEYAKVARYFQQAESVFSIITAQLPQLTADDALALILSAIERLNAVLANGIDDSGGYRFGLETELCQTLVEHFKRLDWSDKRRAEWLAKQLGQDWDVFPTIPGEFELTPAQLQAFTDHCQARLDALPEALQCDEARRRELNALTGVLLMDAKERGDVYSQTRLLAKAATHSHDYLKICQLQLDNDDEVTAQTWLDIARKAQTNDRNASSIEAMQIKIWQADGATDNIEKVAWQSFCDRPNRNSYQQLVQIFSANGIALTPYLADIEQQLIQLDATQNGKKPTFCSNSALDFYLHQQDFNKAADWAENHQVQYHMLADIALKVAKVRPQSAIGFLQRALPHFVNRGDNTAYAQAVDYLVNLRKLWHKQPEHLPHLKVLVDELLVKYKRKRNFVMLMEKQLGDL
ncbi:MAG TPA: SWIM zinc finger family protein [Cellvibrionaceae bacterium]